MWAALIVVLIGIAAWFYGFGGQLSCTGCCVATCGITNDPATWPTGDRIWNVCRAIALAEGANVAGSNPDRLNNPGDVSDHAVQYGSEFHSGSFVTKFPDKLTGWQALYAKIKADLVDGTSSVYSPQMTWAQFAQKYAGDWQDWVKNVTAELQVLPTDVTGDYFGGASCV